METGFSRIVDKSLFDLKCLFSYFHLYINVDFEEKKKNKKNNTDYYYY